MSRYIETFFRNRWLIMIPALVLFAAGVGLALLIPPQYEATATIWTETTTYLDVPEADNRYLSPAEIETRRFSELVQTHTFASAIMKRLPDVAQATEDEQTKFIERLQEQLQVAATGDNTVSVAFTHSDSTTARSVVEFAIDEYKRVVEASSALQAREAIAFYTEQVRMYEEEILPASTKAVSDYLKRNPQGRQVGPDGVPLDPQYALLDQQVRADRAAYQRYQQRLSEVQTQSEAVNTSQPVAFRVIDAPRILPDSGNPSLKLIVLLAGVGLVLSIGYALLFVGLATVLDRTLRTARDIERTLDLPVLDVVPDYAEKRAVRRIARAERKQNVITHQPAQSKPSI